MVKSDFFLGTGLVFCGIIGYEYTKNIQKMEAYRRTVDIKSRKIYKYERFIKSVGLEQEFETYDPNKFDNFDKGLIIGSIDTIDTARIRFNK